MTEIKSLQTIFNLYFHGKYSFDNFINIDIKTHITNQYQINKKTILSVDKQLTEFHNFINLFIVNKLEFNTSICFSYAKNTTVYSCLKPHKNHKYFLTTDIANFFGSICSADISETMQYNINEKKIPISDIDQYKNDIVKLLTFEEKLPIGFSTSGRLSNSILFTFDKKILIKCKSNNITYSRYSDDLIFSSNEKNIVQIKPIVKDILTNIFNGRLKINPNKTKTYSKKSKIKILGLIITPNGDITIDKKMKSNIETAMHFYANDTNKFNSFLKKKFDGNIQKVFGIVAYINSVNKNFLNKLRKKYGNYTVDSFLRKSAK